MLTNNAARVAILEARMSNEMADLIRRNGGEPLRVPAVREAAVSSGEQVAAFIDRLTSGAIQTVVFFTGVGVTALLNEAEQLGRLQELLTALRNSSVVCRGPKPAAVLRRQEIPIAASAAEPYTTTELVEVLVPLDLTNSLVGVVHYGERNDQVVQALQAQHASAYELCLYKWLLPVDTSALQTLVQDIIAGRVDAVVFTSQIQVRHLFQIATELRINKLLTEALNTKTIVASIGPTCTAVLQNYGVTPHVIPEHPKMGHLAKALGAYLAQ